MIQLRPREPPLEPVGVVATGPAVAALRAAAVRRLRAGADLRVAAGDAWLVVLGAPDELPWADGVRYVGRDGPLLVPTTTFVSPSSDLVARALGGSDELVVLLEQVVLRGSMPVDPPDPDQLR
jgi:hypothetical protein